MGFGNRMKHVRQCLAAPSGALAIAVLAALSLAGQIAQTAPKRIFTHDRDVETAFTWTRPPRWESGRLVGYDRTGSAGPIIYTIDRDGRREEALFTLQDGALIFVYGIAGSVDGDIAIVASAVTNDSRGSSFIVRMAPDLKSQVITRTWPYIPLVVTFTPDGGLWTIGNLKDENGRDVAANVLRRFDRNGKMIGSATLNMGSLSAETSYLRSSRDRVGWFSRVKNCYLEFSLDGVEIGRYDGPAGAKRNEITGVVMSEDGEVVAGLFGEGESAFLTLDRDKRTWTTVTWPKEQTPKWPSVPT